MHVASTSKCHRYLATHTPETELEDMLFQDATAVRTLPGSTIVQPDPPRPDIGDPEYSEVLVPLPPGYQSAGTFVVSDDVTTRRNPMLKNRSPEALAMLPYKVLSTDIVLEGIGWVEVTSQVRNRKDKGYQTVDVEVVSPEGKGIAQRKTMSAYMILEEGAREAGLRSTTARPRRSMKGQKKMEKLRSRAM